MNTTHAEMSLSYGEIKRREATAKAKRERDQVSPETRAARAAILDARDAIREKQQANKAAEQQARPDAIRSVLAHASIDELNELLRTVGQLDGRRLAEIVGDVLRQRQHTGYVPAPETPQEPRQRRKV